MNWGTKIAISLGSFILLIVGMGIYMITQNSEKPVENYYEKDLKHEQTIAARRNALHNEPSVNYDTEKQQIVIRFPDTTGIEQGTIYVERPADASQDFSFALQLNHAQQQIIPTQSLLKGLWQVRITWQQKQQQYESKAQKVIIK